MLLVSRRFFGSLQCTALNILGQTSSKQMDYVLSKFRCICTRRQRVWNPPSYCHFSKRSYNSDATVIDETFDELTRDEEYQKFTDRLFKTPEQPHNVLVVQPYYKDPSKRNSSTTPQLQVEESIALINSLPGWRVVDEQLISLINFKKREMFGSRTFEKLKEIVRKNKEISAVFVSVNMFRVSQLIELEKYLEVPCFDRYTIVMQIFRNHATTKEAKLQVAMAEIPYLRQCIKGIPKGFSDRLGSVDLVGGSGLTFEDTRRELLAKREKKLKAALNQLRNHRTRLRQARTKVGFPIIAVVGYTNAGKTSLIKSLTGELKLLPRNQLFATLDVTKHAGFLPCNLEVLYVDTVGFISDIPTNLIESFTATLEDAIHSDLIIHVWDVSHPDSVNQRRHVLNTLRDLQLSEELLGRVLEVGNKIDKVSENRLLELMEAEPNMMYVSSKTNVGLKELVDTIEQNILQATQRFRMVIRVENGGEEFDWLRDAVAVETFKIDEKNPQYCLMGVVLTEAQLEKFKRKFI